MLDLNRGLRWVLVAVLLSSMPADAQNSTAGPDETGNATSPSGPERDPFLPRLFEEELHRLPAPLQEGLGLFVASLAAWVLIGLAVMVVLAPLLKWMSARVPGDLDSKIIGIVSMPGFILIFTFGIVDSFEVLALPAWLLQALDRAWQVVLVAVLTYVVYRVWHEIILDVGRRVSQRTKSDLDDKLYPVFDKIGGVVIVIAGIWFIVASFGVNMTFFAAGAGIGGLVIAFAAQDTLANFFAGVHILLDRPFREGDRIEIKEENTWGDVVDIGLRTTRILTRDNRLVIVPNSLIGSNPIINHSFPSLEYRLTAKVGVAYGTDIERARRVLIDAVHSVDGVVQARDVQALFRTFGESSLDFDVRYWIASYQDTRVIEDRVNTAVYHALEDAGIEIPFPQRVLWNGAKPEASMLG